MTGEYRIYCDESCHLEHDSQSHMVLGGVWCPTDHVRAAVMRLREIKADHGLSVSFELKWGKVSPAKLHYYLDVLDYWADDNLLCLRAVIINKAQLDHTRFDQDHDDWYYKMYFNMLKTILEPQAHYEIFLDIKDTRGGERVESLKDVLRSSLYDFNRDIIRGVEQVRSHEVELIQLADFLIGALAYANRGLRDSEAKLAVVARLRQRTGLMLTRSTLLRATKLNILQWEGRPP